METDIVNLKNLNKQGLLKTSVYMFYNSETKDYYIGSTNDANHRLRAHVSKLEKGIHENSNFQKAYDDNPNFDIGIMAVPDRILAYELEDAILKEQWGDPNLLNICANVEANKAHTGLSLDAKERMSAAMKQRWQDPEYRERTTLANKERWNDPEYRQMMIDISKARANDPIVREHFSSISKEYWKDPAIREQQSLKAKELWSDPEFKEKTSASIKEAFANPELREVISLRNKKRWEDPEYKQTMSTMSRELWEDPEYKDRMIKIRNDPEFKEAASKKSIEQMKDPEARETSRQGALKQWENPEFRAKRSKKVIVNDKIYNSLSEAAIDNKISLTGAFHRVNSNSDKCKGWLYAD